MSLRTALAALLIFPSLARADGSITDWPRAPAPTGRYEGYSALRMAPYGQFAGAPILPRWLDVTTRGNESEILFQPEGRVRWRMTWGAHGLLEKITLVDGAEWTRSRFTYDGAGRLDEKNVSGPGLPHPIAERYRVGSDGKVLGRDGGDERWDVRWDPKGATAETRVAGKLVRIDRFDREGRPLSTVLGHPATSPVRVTLIYDRDPSGALRRVQRQRGAEKPRSVDGEQPDRTITSRDLKQLSGVVERWEALALMGVPATHTTDGKGIKRTSGDRYGEGCWLNDPNEIRYDAADRFVDVHATCICGFCVDARAAVRAGDELGRDEHWTRGPWVRLDDQLDVTADHRVVTDRGPVPAGELRPGDRVERAGGGWRVLRSVRALPVGDERLGLNLRTATGRFFAGDFVLESEAPRACSAQPGAQ